MYLSTIARSMHQRREFNPSNKRDLLDLKYFKKNGKWENGCPFYLQDPFIEVPAMCDSMYTNFMLDKLK